MEIFLNMKRLYLTGGRLIAVHLSYGIDDRPYKYYFENHGFDDINIFIRSEFGDGDYE